MPTASTLGAEFIPTFALTTTCRRGIAVAPHHLAAECAAGILKDGGNAIEAMVGAAATIAAVYAHMNSIGGYDPGSDGAVAGF